jgi:hypothetical protein
MGAKKYPNDLAPRLELLWGIRHVVVHGAGIATADFIKRHPNAVATAGKRLGVGNKDVQFFLEAIKAFMEPTDQYFIARCPSLAVEPRTK